MIRSCPTHPAFRSITFVGILTTALLSSRPAEAADSLGVRLTAAIEDVSHQIAPRTLDGLRDVADLFSDISWEDPETRAGSRALVRRIGPFLDSLIGGSFRDGPTTEFHQRGRDLSAQDLLHRLRVIGRLDRSRFATWGRSEEAAIRLARATSDAADLLVDRLQRHEGRLGEVLMELDPRDVRDAVAARLEGLEESGGLIDPLELDHWFVVDRLPWTRDLAAGIVSEEEYGTVVAALTPSWDTMNRDGFGSQAAATLRLRMMSGEVTNLLADVVISGMQRSRGELFGHAVPEALQSRWRRRHSPDFWLAESRFKLALHDAGAAFRAEVWSNFPEEMHDDFAEENARFEEMLRAGIVNAEVRVLIQDLSDLIEEAEPDAGHPDDSAHGESAPDESVSSPRPPEPVRMESVTESVPTAGLRPGAVSLEVPSPSPAARQTEAPGGAAATPAAESTPVAGSWFPAGMAIIAMGLAGIVVIRVGMAVKARS